jgi:histidine phosphotransferase ChpT
MNHITSLSPSLEFTQLLMTKFCHDITGPIGAINNGVELVHDDASIAEVAMELIADSAKAAMLRLQYYRFAYGIIKQDALADRQDMQEMLVCFFKAQKIDLHIQTDEHDYTQYEYRILCNLCLIAASALIRGGEMHISCTRKNGLARLVIKATGRTVALYAQIMDAIGAQTIEADKKTVQAYYTMLLVHEAGKLSYHVAEDSLTLTYEAVS